ncbi:MAG: hypothetical protein QM723_33980 [Myxococcaceae bacterium]
MSTALLALMLSAASVQLDAPQVSVELAEAVRTELATAGFSAEGEPVVARLALLPSEGAIDCTVEDRVTHKTVTRRLAYDPAAPRANRRLAVQVVELLHASLAEARFAPTPAPVPTAVNAFLEQREPPPSPPRWRLEASGGVAVLSQGIQPWVSLGGRFRIGPIEAGLYAGAIAHTWTVSGELGSADLGLADARVVASVPFDAGWVTLRPELSSGALLAWATGHTDLHGYVGTTGTATAAAAGAALNAELPLNDFLALTARAALAVAVPAIKMQFADTRVATIGQPMFSISIGLSLR